MPTLPVSLGDIMTRAQRVMPGHWTPETKKMTRKLALRHLKNLSRLGEAHPASLPSKGTHGRSYWALQSFAGRFCSFVLSYSPKLERLTLADVMARAGDVNTRVRSDEPVWFDVTTKHSGEARPVSRHGQISKAATSLSGQVCQTLMGGPSPYEYSRRGRGRDRMIRDALNSFKDGGVRWFIAVDVRKFHPSFNKDVVPDLIPLPRSVVRNSFLIPDDASIKFSPAYLSSLSPTSSLKAVLAGLPMGSSTSVLIASKLIQTLLAAIPCRFMACHGDNILIGVRTEEEADAVIHALASMFAKHPAGPFKLNYADKFKPESETDVMGYRFRYGSTRDGGYARVTPSAAGIRRCQKRLAYDLLFLPPDQWSATIEQRLLGWCQSHGQWAGRRYGADIAVVDFCGEVLPRLKLSEAKLKKHSFKGDLSALPKVFNEIWSTLQAAQDALNCLKKSTNGRPISTKASSWALTWT